MRYPTHEFLIVEALSDDWLVEPDPLRDLGCTLEERIKTIHYSLVGVIIQFNTNASLETEGGLVSLSSTH